MPSELRPVVQALGLRPAGELGGLALHRGERDGVEIVATGTGVGPDLATVATSRLLSSLDLDHVVVSGIAGGIPGATAVGDLVVPEDVVDAATGDRFAATASGGLRLGGTIRTSDGTDYGLGEEDLARLRAEGVVALDMETAAVARVCHQRGVPWLALRGISDMAGDGSVGAVVLTLVRPDGSPDAAATLRFLLAHPWRVPRLLRLGRDAGRAAGVAARATAVACRSR